MTPEARQRRRDKRDRKLAEYREAIAALRAAGRSCSNCQHWGRAPIGMKDRICDLDSDHEGYVAAKPDHLCTRHDFR